LQQIKRLQNIKEYTLNLSRRQFFALAGASATGAVLLSPLQAFYAKPAIAAGPYGNLLPDPNGVLDLPANFTYSRLSETGQTMNDGYRVPGNHDGMGAFRGSNGNTILIRNHELAPSSSNGLSAPSHQSTTQMPGAVALNWLLVLPAPWLDIGES
jgi:secreted PhoX family phosphatase